jgi:cytochrome oxidase Cu insertion factor (SCO1/SenC/PrrC family)
VNEITRTTKRRWIPWTVLVVAFAGLAIAAWWRGPSRRLVGGGATLESSVLTTPATEAPGELAHYGQVPDFELVSQTGSTVRRADLLGGVWIGDFIFTNCASSCPMMSAQMQKLRDALGDVQGVRLVSFSVDPERDTPEKLAEYARGYNARPEQWLFLTGDKAAVRRLATEGFHLPADDASPEDVAQGAESVLHSTRIALVDSQGRIRGYYDGMDAEAMAKLGADVRRLVGGAAS